MEYGGFGKKSGPTSSTNPNSAQQFFANVVPSQPNPSSSILRSPRPYGQSTQSFGDGPRPFGQTGAQFQRQRPSSYSQSVTSVVGSRSSENNASFKFSRSQQDNSGGFNQPVPKRNNLSSGGFRPSTVGVVPIRQSVHPRTNSPDLAYNMNNRAVEGYRPLVEAQPVPHVARPRNYLPEQVPGRNQPVDLDNFPPLSVGAGPARHTARPRSNSPNLASRSYPVVDPDSFPPLSVGAGPARHTARPRANAPELASRSNQFVNFDSYTPISVGARPVHNIARPRANSPELTSRSNQFLDPDSFPPLSAGAAPVHYTARPRTNPPEQDRHQVIDFDSFPPSTGAGPVWPAAFRNSVDSRPRSPVSYASLQAMQNQPPVSPYYDSESFQYDDDVQGTNQTRPPTSQADEKPHFLQTNSKRSSFIHSRASGIISNVNSSTHDSQAPKKSSPRTSNHVPEAAATNPASFLAVKRLRSPPVSSNKVPTGKFDDIQDDEREIQAKAKRLARFKVELREKLQSSNDDSELKVSTNLHEPSIVGRNKLVPEFNDDLSTDLEGSSATGVIIGLCTDMCPESERGERERKGDLDRFERLDGDRNQTSKNLAVKKYNRTAEREAHLIRPMPILQKTIEYLLKLLEQPYNDKFLGTYNFLWDRMRAIRMDLRMQHIFNQAAITMLEQMIRLHIIAMHELCEYSRGEGFSEGFDAHLNIEQMNKTSVELFQMYDDHRKKGIVIPTEEEFRGYYALLKLDKHPGYMVEPAELSLDLAKMTPEIRQTKEVLFARAVARACRTGNFIAFFRLAKKASYLQACLMHAHFAKLRTHALASLHAGLQNNQGLPVIHAATWLAMEEEDMESLLEYHGFLIKVFDEPYMVKDGPFLNGEKDFETRCSKLVDMKKSGSILEDVVPSTEAIRPAKVYQSLGKTISPTNSLKKIKMVKKNDNERKVFPYDRKKRPINDIAPIEASSPVYAVDGDMADSEGVPSPKDFKVTQPMPEIPVPSQQRGSDHQLPGSNPFSWDFILPKPLPSKVSNDGRPSFDTSFIKFSHVTTHAGIEEAIPSRVASKQIVQDSLLDVPSNLVVEKPALRALVTQVEEEPPVLPEEIENEDVEPDYYEDEEIAEAKLKLIIRSWKRRASRKRELREKRQLAANAALNLLPLGPLVQLRREPPNMLGEFDIDQSLRERSKKHEQSWSRLNVSEEIAGTLSGRNPAAKCVCWKMIVCSQVSKPDEAETGQSADSALRFWLLSKLMPSNKDDDGDLLISSPGLTISKKWISGQSHSDQTCCLSVVKDANFNNPTETVTGASAVLFLVRCSIPWSLQKANLRRLIELIPCGSCLPLLILSSSVEDEATDNSSIIVNELGLLDVDESRISSFVVISLRLDGFFSDNQLREGLRWLASESPSQLIPHRIKTRDLVLAHLSPYLEALKDTEVSPNDFVSAFNEALEQSLFSIDAAAKSNPTGWPCPELSLLDQACPEHRFLEGHYVPENGWSSVDRIGLLVSSLQDCKLPVFRDDLTYLLEGSDTIREIEIQRVEFGKSLIGYLTESSKLMGLSLAAKEAGIMLQSCRLELHSSFFRIVPNWAVIFRRIFNWRLMSVAGEAAAAPWAYVLERPDISPTFDDLDSLNQPSLDEMIKASSGPVLFSNSLPLRVADRVLPQEVIDLMEDDSEADIGSIREVVVGGEVEKESDRLSKLLEKCNILQNMIDDKLSVYF